MRTMTSLTLPHLENIYVIVGSILAFPWIKTLTQQLWATGGRMGGGTPRPVLLTGAKKSHLGCLIASSYLRAFRISFSLINKIHPLKKTHLTNIDSVGRRQAQK